MKLFLAQMKPYLGNVNKNLILMETYIKKAVNQECSIIVFPELSLSGYLLEDLVSDVAITEIPKLLLEWSKEISIIFGAVELGKDYQLYNSSFYLEDGKLIHTHRKIYLPTYGMFDEGRYFKAGNEIKAFDTKYGRFGILICEDMWHSTSSYILAQDGATHIFVSSSSPARGFGEEFSIKKEWDSLNFSAAVSNGVFVTFVNRTGVEDGVSFWGGSKVFGPAGEKLNTAVLFKEEGIEVKLDKESLKRARITSPAKDEKISLVFKELSRIWRG